MRGKYFGMLVWLLTTVLVGAWVAYHHPIADNWRPATFAQFVLCLVGWMLWFLCGMACELYFGSRR